MSFLTGIGNTLVILHGTTARSSLRAPIIHGVLLYLAYVAVLSIYFLRLPVAPGVGLVLGVLCVGALELLLLLCVVALLLGAGPLRAHRWRAFLYALVMLLFTLAWLVQGHALLSSHAFVSPMMLENVRSAPLTASLQQDLLLAFGVLACGFTVVLSWRGSSRWMEHGGGCGGVLLAVLASAGVAALNLHGSVASGRTGLAAWQSPVASLLRVGVSVRPMDTVTGEPPAASHDAVEVAAKVPTVSTSADAANASGGRPSVVAPSGSPRRMDPGVLATATPTQTCAFDSLDGQQFPADVPKRVGPGQSFVAHGWLTGRDLQSPGPFTLVMRGSQVWGFAAATGMERPDVAAALHAPSAGRAGFNLKIDAQTLPAGSYEVLGLVDQGHGVELCDMHRQLTIGAPAAP